MTLTTISRQSLLMLSTLIFLLPGLGRLAAAEPRALNAADLRTLGEPVALAAAGCNRAFHFSISRAELRADYAGHSAPLGQRWLVLDLAVENRMPVDLLYDLDYPEDLLVASMSRQSYLLINGLQVARRTLFGNHDAGAMPNEFVLPRWGEKVEGQIIFPIPEQGIESLSLRYYHDQYAPVVVNLLGNEPGKPYDTGRSDVLFQANGLMEMGVFGAEFSESIQGTPAADGMQWLTVDLRGRSFWTIEADALALERQASPTEKVDLLKVIEYVEAGGLVQVVADGEHAYLRNHELSTLPVEPPFLPDAMAGGQAVFQVPASAESLMLELHFPEFRGPGIDEPIPDSMIFALQGDAIQPVYDDLFGEIADQPTPLSLHGLERMSQFASHRADDGQILLILDASMRNTSQVGGMMNISERIDLMAEDGAAIEFVGLYNRGPVLLEEPFWLPAGGAPRRFRLVYRLPADDKPVELIYRGVSINRTVALPNPD